MKEKVLLSVLLLCVTLIVSVNADINPKDYPKELNAYGLDFTVSSPLPKINPRTVISVDSNLQILLDCFFKPTPIDKLNDKFSVSQIFLLQAMEMVNVDDSGIVKTIVPVLNKEQSKSKRLYVDKAVEKVIPVLEPKINNLKKLLDKQGNAGNLYNVFSTLVIGDITKHTLYNKYNFSLPFHNTIWRGIVAIIEKNKNSDFFTYINYPSLGNTTRTFAFRCLIKNNPEYFSKIYTIFGIKDSSEAFGLYNKKMMKIAEEYTKNKRITDKNIIEQLSKYNLVNKDGEFTIPTIYKNTELYKVCKDLADVLVNSFGKDINIDEYMEKYHIQSDVCAYNLVYEDWKYILVKKLLKAGVLKQPKALTDTKDASLDDFRDVFIAFERY